MHLSEEDKAMDDANTYEAMEMDLSSSCCEQAAALVLMEVSRGIFSILCCIPWPCADVCLSRSMPKHARHSRLD